MAIETGPFLTPHVVGLAASAGGLNALSVMLSALPADFCAPIIIVQHLAPEHPSLMPDILRRHTALKVQEAREGDALRPGIVYTAPSDEHVVVNVNGTISLSHALPIHFVRPSADALFASMAASCHERAIAVVLTGTGVDGADGIKCIKAMGGTVIAQDEATSAHFGMPSAAIHTGSVDYILPLEEIAPALMQLVGAGLKV